MEAKLKALRVADLRELLQKASVPIPAKANKADLVAKILSSPAAVNVFNNPTTSASPVSKPKIADLSQGGGDDDLLAPPEEFDWGPASAANGVAASSAVPTQSAPKVDHKSPVGVGKHNALSAKQSASEKTAPPQKAADLSTSAVETVLDAELEKRKKRAARFGVPLVEVKPKPNGAKTSRGVSKPQTVSSEDVAKAEARAARFGIPTNTATTGEKRARSPAGVDKEELERRKKRAERFATGEIKAS